MTDEGKQKQTKYPVETVSVEAHVIVENVPSRYLVGVTYPKKAGYCCPRCKSMGRVVKLPYMAYRRLTSSTDCDTVECPECGLSVWIEHQEGHILTDRSKMKIAEFLSEEVYATNHSILKGLERNDHDLE